MASSRKTATNENVGTYDSAGGQDYSAVDTWESATDIDLVTATQSEVLECYKGNHDDTCNLAGATTNASYFRIVRPAGTKGQASWEGHAGIPVFDGTVVSFDSAQGSANHVISDDYTQIQDICCTVELDSGSDLAGCCKFTSCDQAAYVGVLIADVTNIDTSSIADGFKSITNGGNGPNFFINCLSTNCDGKGFKSTSTAGTIYAYNCTSIDNNEGFDHSSGGTWTCTNCIADGSVSTDFDSGVIGNYNASGDATAPGANSRINQTFTFVNAANDDYHLASTDAGALGFGTDLSADGTYAFDDDVDWDTRS